MESNVKRVVVTRSLCSWSDYSQDFHLLCWKCNNNILFHFWKKRRTNGCCHRSIIRVHFPQMGLCMPYLCSYPHINTQLHLPGKYFSSKHIKISFIYLFIYSFIEMNMHNRDEHRLLYFRLGNQVLHGDYATHCDL